MKLRFYWGGEKEIEHTKIKSSNKHISIINSKETIEIKLG